MTMPPPGKVATAMQALRDDNDALRDLIAAITETASLPRPLAASAAAWRFASRDLAIVTAAWCKDVASGEAAPGRAAAAIREQHARSAASYEHWAPAPEATP
jgi:hypothetical protein